MYYQPSYRSVKSRPKTIKVSGEGKVAAKSDMAEAKLGVTTENPVLAEAQKENAHAISNIIKALNQAGIHERDMQTIDYSIQPQYDYVDGRQVFRTYKVNHMLLINVSDINRAGTIVDTAVRNGANVISGITFETSQYEKFYRKALSLAVVDAKRKAETIAQTLHVKLSHVPLSTTEITGGDIVPFQTKTLAVGEAATSFQPGMLEITSQVNAEFSFSPM